MGISAICLFVSQGISASAMTIKEENIANNQSLAVQSNAVANWPTGPVVAAESAILMDADTGAILYAKNIHQREYPASTTKILTTLIASERCSMDEIVDFSYDAVHDIDPGSNHIAIDPGEQLTMEECLNAILIRSANEVSFAVAEHISGTTWQDFGPIMNERAKELGCVDSHFVNPNGLPNEDHYTSAYDLAMIGRAFFANEALCKMTMTHMLHISPSERQPDDIMEVNKMELIPGGKYAYPYLVGCKTGYTDAARSTLVSCAEKDGMKLINFGSGAQYNKARDLVKVKEDTIGTVIPKDDYGYSKYVMSEYLGVRESSNKPGIIYNPIIFGLYGQGEDYTFKFISNAIMKNLLEMPIVINQNVVFDYLYLGDFLKVMDKLIEEDVPNREFNITPTESIDLCSIVEIINEIGDFKSEVTVKNPGLNYQYTADNTRLLENMGNDFVFTSYKEGIKELYDYYKENLDRLDTEAIRKDELLKYCKTKG